MANHLYFDGSASPTESVYGTRFAARAIYFEVFVEANVSQDAFIYQFGDGLSREFIGKWDEASGNYHSNYYFGGDMSEVSNDSKGVTYKGIMVHETSGSNIKLYKTAINGGVMEWPSSVAMSTSNMSPYFWLGDGYSGNPWKGGILDLRLSTNELAPLTDQQLLDIVSGVTDIDTVLPVEDCEIAFNNFTEDESTTIINKGNLGSEYDIVNNSAVVVEPYGASVPSALVFDGSSNPTTAIAGTGVTVNTMYMKASLTLNSGVICAGSGGNSFDFVVDDGGGWEFYSGDSLYNGYSGEFGYEVDTEIVISYNGSAFVAFVDGVSSNFFDMGAVVPTSTTFKLGSFSALAGKLYDIRFSEKILTTQEALDASNGSIESILPNSDCEIAYNEFEATENITIINKGTLSGEHNLTVNGGVTVLNPFGGVTVINLIDIDGNIITNVYADGIEMTKVYINGILEHSV